jgi:hypothetical protein
VLGTILGCSGRAHACVILSKDEGCKKLLQFSYGNHLRVVEPHILGRDSAGHDVLSDYLVRGYSESRKQPYWRFFLLSDLKLLTMLDETFSGPRKGYYP